VNGKILANLKMMMLVMLEKKLLIGFARKHLLFLKLMERKQNKMVEVLEMERLKKELAKSKQLD